MWHNNAHYASTYFYNRSCRWIAAALIKLNPTCAQETRRTEIVLITCTFVPFKENLCEACFASAGYLSGASYWLVLGSKWPIRRATSLGTKYQSITVTSFQWPASCTSVLLTMSMAEAIMFFTLSIHPGSFQILYNQSITLKDELIGCKRSLQSHICHILVNISDVH